MKAKPALALVGLILAAGIGQKMLQRPRHSHFTPVPAKGAATFSHAPSSGLDPASDGSYQYLEVPVPASTPTFSHADSSGLEQAPDGSYQYLGIPIPASSAAIIQMNHDIMKHVDANIMHPERYSPEEQQRLGRRAGAWGQISGTLNADNAYWNLRNQQTVDSAKRQATAEQLYHENAIYGRDHGYDPSPYSLPRPGLFGY